MKYETFEELYKDNRELIDFEFKRRFYEVLDKILNQIDYYQLQEHKEIDGFNNSMVDDVFRDNIDKLEKIYKPLYNYIKTISMPLMERDNIYLQEMKHKFIDIVLPDSEIEKLRGTRDWRVNYEKNRRKQMALAELLEGLLYNAYILGASNIDCEPENHYDTDAYGYKLDENGNPTDTFANHRRRHVSHMKSYGKMSWGRMVSFLYDSGYKHAIEKGDNIDKAHECGMNNAVSFLKDVFKGEE